MDGKSCQNMKLKGEENRNFAQENFDHAMLLSY